jgi:hypothetical protein
MQARELVRRKSSLLTRSTLPGKLADCTSESSGLSSDQSVLLEFILYPDLITCLGPEEGPRKCGVRAQVCLQTCRRPGGYQGEVWVVGIDKLPTRLVVGPV